MCDSTRVRETTGEDDAREFCAKIGMVRRVCGDTTYEYREGGNLGHVIDEALGVRGRLDLLQ